MLAIPKVLVFDLTLLDCQVPRPYLVEAFGFQIPGLGVGLGFGD